MSKLSSNSIFFIILLLFFSVLFLNYYFKINFTKESFSPPPNDKINPINPINPILLDPTNNIYYSGMNGYVFIIDGSNIKLISPSKKITEANINTDREILDAIPQTFQKDQVPYCYQITKEQKYLVFIPGTKDKTIPFITIIDTSNSSNLLTDAAKAKFPVSLSKYKNYDSLKVLEATNSTFFDSVNGNILVTEIIEGREYIKILYTATNSVISYDTANVEEIKNMNDRIPSTFSNGPPFVYEIFPGFRYMFYIPTQNNPFINIIDVNSSISMITSGDITNKLPTLTPTTPRLATKQRDYSMLDNLTANLLFDYTKGIPRQCPRLNSVIMNWYRKCLENKGNLDAQEYMFGNIDGNGGSEDPFRFANPYNTEMLIPYLIPDPKKGSAFGKYEDILKSSRDTDGSSTMNIIPGSNKSLKQTLIDFSATVWKITIPVSNP